MTEAVPLRTVRLENGLQLDFYDRSNRYFGDFHRVLLQVEVRLTPGCDTGSEAAGQLQDVVLLRRDLERMGVSTKELDAVRNALVESFLVSSSGYLQRSDVPAKLVSKYRAEIQRRRSPLEAFLRGE